MKKFIALFTALILTLSLCTVAYGAGSPEGKKEFSVSVYGNVGAWPDIIYTVEEGDTYDLSAPEKADGHTFLCWTIKGEYDIVSGDLNSTDLTIRPKSDISAYVWYIEPVDLKDNEVKIEFTHNIPGLEDGNYDVAEKGEEYELSTPESYPGYSFVKWEIVGSYEIVSGDLESLDLVIIPHGSIIVKRIFEELPEEEEPDEKPDEEPDEEPDKKPDKEEEKPQDDEDDKKPPKGESNDSEESPQTGMAFPVAGLLAALGAAVVSKKLSK